MGCDAAAHLRGHRCDHFNPRTRMGCDRDATAWIPPKSIFQSTHPHGVRREAEADVALLREFQSTHPHGVRLQLVRDVEHEPLISIHAPAWGATDVLKQNVGGVNHFNPRTRMGCDTAEARSHRARRISIHAPAWGATVSPPQSLRQGRFQSTHPHGVRPLAAVTFAFSLYFNPRTRMGCDNVQYKIFFCNTISIHAPAWGATLITLARCLAMLNFNPRTRMGCDIIWSDLKVAI